MDERHIVLPLDRTVRLESPELCLSFHVSCSPHSTERLETRHQTYTGLILLLDDMRFSPDFQTGSTERSFEMASPEACVY
jgi:hypothetical protein